MTIRLAIENDIAQISKINIDNWKTTYWGVLPTDYLNNLNNEETEKKWMQYLKRADTFIYIAVDADNLAYGFAACQYELGKPGTGLLYSLHTATNSRGRGIGKKLIAAVANHFKQNSIKTLTIWVVEGNDVALSIYKHLGAEVYIHETHQFDLVSVPEIGLVWKDINVLCKL
jgi:ribosomal protein S18 acetylase RimI-like enzyme